MYLYLYWFSRMFRPIACIYSLYSAIQLQICYNKVVSKHWKNKHWPELGKNFGLKLSPSTRLLRDVDEAFTTALWRQYIPCTIAVETDSGICWKLLKILTYKMRSLSILNVSKNTRSLTIFNMLKSAVNIYRKEQWMKWCQIIGKL